MKGLLKRLFLVNHSIEEIASVKEDIIEDNRKCVILYSSIVAGAMCILLFLSLFVDVLKSSRTAYVAAIALGLVLLLLCLGPAKKSKGVTVVCQFTLVAFLLAFGIILGTVVEPGQASASFAVMIFAAPLLFTDLPVHTNMVTVISIIVYIFTARATQNDTIFAFNMSVIMPFGLSNLVLTHFTSKMKIERSLYAYEKKRIAEYDRLTGLRNRWSFERDAEALKADENAGTVGVCSFDVNYLKKVNDNLGHKAGDELLIAAAGAIERTFGKYGKCYRTGGDEFMALIGGIYPAPGELLNMLNREAALCHSSFGFEITVSGGIAEGKPADLDALTVAADEQMYCHKRQYYAENGAELRINDCKKA